MRKVAIIPARGGSKRIPRKNIKAFFGKPIIAYSLQSGLESQIFDHIHVSTEDKEIYDIVSNLGFKPKFYRSSGCSQGHVPVKEVLIESLQKFEKLGENFGIICLLSATAPLINGNDLRQAYQKFEDSNFQYPLLAVARYPVPIEWAMTFDSAKVAIEPVNKGLFYESSHNFEGKYYDVGSFAFFTKNQLFSTTGEVKFIPYVLPMTKSVDVDNPEDWEELESLYRAQGSLIKHKID